MYILTLSPPQGGEGNSAQGREFKKKCALKEEKRGKKEKGEKKEKRKKGGKKGRKKGKKKGKKKEKRGKKREIKREREEKLYNYSGEGSSNEISCHIFLIGDIITFPGCLREEKSK